ncbi:hypothetical protein PAHAL_8G245900 [Panicum hallii]|uniref:Uncharacterized protein n=1 Tax=Panicum hallii TaxID=206008 RepID=A0A2T8IA63_9POAL|nr:hypothetical protein PAHAL_8G245900 [Panicum hallii]
MWFLASPVCACQVLDALPAWGQILFLVEGWTGVLKKRPGLLIACLCLRPLLNPLLAR